MKWHVCSIAVLYFVFCSKNILAFEDSTMICRNLTAFHDLWKSSAYGEDPSRTERAAWIVRNADGGYEFVIWPHSAAGGSEMWTGKVPVQTVAQVHTHPKNLDPKPSKNDSRIAAKVKVPIYVISKDGIWRVNPDGQFKKEANRGWFKKMSGACI